MNRKNTRFEDFTTEAQRQAVLFLQALEFIQQNPILTQERALLYQVGSLTAGAEDGRRNIYFFIAPHAR